MSSTSSSTASCSDNVCSICLDTCSVASYADGCLHKFCGRCIFEWAQRSQLCPICRTYFATIITNVTSDTEYEVIPLEDRRVPVTNFIRDSWWTNNFSRNGYPSNRNIFAVRQFPQRSNQLQPYQPYQPYQPEHPQQPQPQSLPLPSSSSEPSRTIEPQQQPQVNNDDFLDQATRRFDDLQIDNQPRPERIVWSSQRYSNRQFNRLSQPQQQQPQQLDPQLDPQLEPQPELETDEQQQLQLQPQPLPQQPPPPALPPPFSNLRGHNHHINSPRHSPRPLRPLVGIRQETHEVQNQQHYPQHYQQNQPQYHHHHQHQHHQMQHHYPQHRHHRQYQHSPHHHHQPHPQHQINLNYQPPHHSYHHHPHHSNSHYSNHHIHPHPNSNHPNPPHPHHFNPHHNPHSYKRLSRPNDRHRRR